MNTGKVEYSPDYKSAKRNEPAIKLLDEWLSRPVVEETPEMEEFRKQINGELDTEHQRLQSAVVEKARIMLELHESVGHVCLDVEDTLEATRALIAFEAEHGITNESKERPLPR